MRMKPMHRRRHSDVMVQSSGPVQARNILHEMVAGCGASSCYLSEHGFTSPAALRGNAWYPLPLERTVE